MTQSRTSKHLIPNLELAYILSDFDHNTGGIATKDNWPGEHEHACALHERFSDANVNYKSGRGGEKRTLD